MHAQVCRPTLASKTILAFQASNQNRGDNPMKSAWKPFVLGWISRGYRGYRRLEAFPNHPCFHVLPIIKCGKTCRTFTLGKTWGGFRHQTWYVTM